MIQIILMAALSPMSSQIASVPVETCVWPHRCVQAAALPVETCVWPHKCS